MVADRGRRSARRLKIDTIDLYQVHHANPFVPDGTTMDGMRQLQRDGLVRHVGVSNYPSNDGSELKTRSVRPW